MAAWRYTEAWDLLQFGLRLGDNPRIIVTTTPKPTKIIKELVKSPMTVISKGSSYENRDYLAPVFFDEIVKKYEGTRLGRQELYAEILDDVEGALWNYALLDRWRVSKPPKSFKRIVVSIDPAITSEEGSDETGIIVSGLGPDDHGYVLEDLSGKLTPNEWARRAIDAYRRWQADRMVGEVNQGGDMVESIIRHVDPTISYKPVHATKGKYTRAEPVAALDEQGRVHHVGSFPALEDQLCNWVQGDPSPDRLDARVWGITELMLESYSSGFFVTSGNRKW